MVRVNRRLLFLTAVYTVILAAAGYLGYRLWQVNTAMDYLTLAPMGQFKGPEDAEKIIVEFLDYRCSHCRDADKMMNEFLSRHPDVKVIHRHYPVFGIPSVIDAQAALAAGKQGKYNEVHDILITRDSPMSDREMDEMAASLGLDVEKFRRDMKAPDTIAFLIQTGDLVNALDVKAVPAFFVGKEYYSGVPSVEFLEGLLEKAYGPSDAE